MPKYGLSLEKFYVLNNKYLPLAIVFDIGVKILDILE
jgi:hypothetical protein